MLVKIKKLDEKAIIPSYKHKGDMGLDITAIDVTYDEKFDRFIYHTGLAFQIPEGYGMLIFPRSSNTKTEAYLPNSVGILDSTYTGELTFAYKLRTSKDVLFPDEDSIHSLEMINEFAPYSVGDKIGQIVIMPYPEIEFEEVNELSDTERGSDGGINRNDTNFAL